MSGPSGLICKGDEKEVAVSIKSGGDVRRFLLDILGDQTGTVSIMLKNESVGMIRSMR